MDLGDRALEVEEADRKRALHQARSRPVEPGLYVDGRRVCLDCEEPIPAARLERAPAAVRCWRCQTQRERGRR